MSGDHANGSRPEPCAMPPSVRIGWLFEVRVPLMVLALILQTITLASGNYRTVLIASLVLTAVADACFVAAFLVGGRAARCASVLLMLPTVFVVADFLYR